MPGDPLRREVHHRDHETTHELILGVVHRELGAGGLDAELGAEVDGEDVRRLQRLGVS